MQFIKRFTFILLSMLLLSSCNAPGTYMSPADVKKPVLVNGKKVFPEFIPIAPDIFTNRAPYPPKYRVGPQDILTIIVWNHPELTIPSMQTTSENVNIYSHISEANNIPSGILIDEKGDIFFPLAGKIKVGGLTVDQIREKIMGRLRKYIRNPQVSVRVAAFRNKPVYIIGEVMKQGVQYITDFPLNIMDVINQAGGIDRESSDTHYIYIIRGDFIRPKVFWLDASTPSAVLMAVHFNLQPRDIIMVSTSGVTRYSRIVNRILPTVQTIMTPQIKNDYN